MIYLVSHLREIQYTIGLSFKDFLNKNMDVIFEEEDDPYLDGPLRLYIESKLNRLLFKDKSYIPYDSLFDHSDNYQGKILGLLEKWGRREGMIRAGQKIENFIRNYVPNDSFGEM